MSERYPETGTPSTRAIGFFVKLRSGGGTGTTLQLTVPKDVVEFLKLKEGQFVSVALHVVPEKEKAA